MGEEHPLHYIPHDVVGRAVKDPAFRGVVLGLKDDREALNNYLVDEGHAPLGREAYDAIRSLDEKQVKEALKAFDTKNIAS